MAKGFYYRITEAQAYLEKKRRGLKATMKVYALDKIENGYWPIYHDHTSKFAETEESAREIIQNYLDKQI